MELWMEMWIFTSLHSTISKTDRVMGAAFPPSSTADTPWVGLHIHPQPLPAAAGAELTSTLPRLSLSARCAPHAFVCTCPPSY
eukprot:scaffold222182_cov31-Tisochrysis_lutea.AAC.1